MANTDASGVLKCNSVALGLLLILALLPAAIHAINPDIPRLQANAQRGSIKEEVELGAAYYAGAGVAQDEKLAAYWYQKAADAGDPIAQRQLGYFYLEGIGVQRDPEQAARWFQRAAAGGLISANVNLGVAYLQGHGVKKDTTMARELFQQAYAKRNGMAACYLGEMYMHGLGVEKDETAAEHWYENGAKLHDARSEFQLASLLWHRRKDINEAKKAVKLLRQAAAAGMVMAKHQLGVILVKNPELANSPQEASVLLKEASEAGEWRSSTALGLIWRDGMVSVQPDPKKAYYYYRLAVLQGGQEAMQIVTNELGALSARLGADQSAAVDADAKTWFQSHHLALEFVSKDGRNWKETPVTPAANQLSSPMVRLIPTDPLAGFVQDPPRRPMAR